jgi:hypothetical protein
MPASPCPALLAPPCGIARTALQAPDDADRALTSLRSLTTGRICEILRSVHDRCIQQDPPGDQGFSKSLFRNACVMML